MQVQDKDKRCVCSERCECLWCLERTAAHTLLSFSNTDHKTHRDTVSIHARLESQRPNCLDVRRHCAKLMTPTPPLTPLPTAGSSVDIRCQWSCDDGGGADETGLTPQMRTSRLAQVGWQIQAGNALTPITLLMCISIYW